MPLLEQQIKQKIERFGIPLKDWDVHIYRGILTGLNEAFIIDSATRDALIAADPKSAEIIRPILRGRDIKRYQYNYANLYIIATFPSRHHNINDFPAVKEYLASFGIERLEQSGKTYIIDGTEVRSRKKTRNQWFETQDSISYWDDFSKQKIVWGEISDKPKFSMDALGKFTTEATTFLMTGESLYYLLGFLNSKVSQYFFARIGTTTGVGTIRWKKFKIEELRVPPTSILSEDYVIALVKEIINTLKDAGNTSELENNLNQAIYSSFGLTSMEIAIIENYCNSVNM